MKVPLTVLILAAAVTASGQPGRAEHMLDLLTYPLTPDTSTKGAGLAAGHAGGVAGQQPEPTFRLSLLSLDREDYVTGDPLIYEVGLENISKHPVDLPWSPDRVLFQTPEPFLPVPSAILFLEVRDRAGLKKLAMLDGQALYVVGSRR